MNNKIKIMTYNIQHGLDYMELINNKKRIVNFTKIINLINEYNPDIICLNEVYGSGVGLEYFDQVEYLARKLNYPYYYFSKAINLSNRGDYGNAIISKIPYEEAIKIEINDPIIKDEDVFYEHRVITKFYFNGFTLLHSHFGLASSEQKNAYQAVINSMDKHKCLLVGDLNMVDESEIIQKLHLDFIDSTLEYNKKIVNTFPSIKPIKKIDYIFLTPDLVINYSKVIDCISSDHLPIICEFGY